jgi:energy-coupling factor transporter ATP-binding protein EcfA2
MELTIDRLSKRYGQRWALRELSLHCEPGMLGLVGPNGAGKTSLMRMIATLLEPMVASAWRTSPRSRRLLLVPILASLPTIACALFFAIMMPLGIQRPPLILPAFLFYGGTVVSTIAIIRAIRQARIADTWLRWANHLSWLVVGGMVLMLIGVVCWGLALALVTSGWFAGLIPWLPFPFGMLLAMMVALWASFWRVQPPASQPWPHDASPSEVASSGEPRGDRG